MERPVTRRELKIELGALEARFDHKLDMWGGALVARLQAVEGDVAGLKTDVAGLKTDVAGLKTDVAGLKTDVAGLKGEVAGLREHVSREVRAAMEWALGQFRAIDDKYVELPARVNRLERKVFPPKRARRR